MKRPTLPILIAISAVNPLSLNILQPAIPGLAIGFMTSYGTAQLTLTAYLAAFAVAQLVHGPLSDRYGRRPVVLGGFVLFLVGTLACSLATSIEALIASRVIQAAGGCAGFILARAIVRDLHNREKSASQLGYITTVMVIAPMVSPALGSLVDAQFGWRGIFATLLLIGVAVLAVSYVFLHETRPARTGAGPALFSAFGILMRNRLFLAHTATLSFTTATFFSFLGGAPYVVVNILDEAPSTYGIYFIVSSLGYMVGNFIAGRTAERVGARALTRYGTALAVAAAAGMAVTQWLAPWSVAALFISMVPVTIAQGLTLPSVTASTVSVRPDLAGAAAGLSGSLQLGLSAFGSWLVAWLLADTAWPMIAVMGATAVLAFIAARIAGRLSDNEPRTPARHEVGTMIVPQ
jgi:DHA1 family bicyclomycin/chloramphenicol resistance-like MFS transporter